MQDGNPWIYFDQPVWWEYAEMFVIADRHTEDGTRQHLVDVEVPDGTVIRNAQIISKSKVQGIK